MRASVGSRHRPVLTVRKIFAGFESQDGQAKGRTAVPATWSHRELLFLPLYQQDTHQMLLSTRIGRSPCIGR